MSTYQVMYLYEIKINFYLSKSGIVQIFIHIQLWDIYVIITIPKSYILQAPEQTHLKSNHDDFKIVFWLT